MTQAHEAWNVGKEAGEAGEDQNTELCVRAMGSRKITWLWCASSENTLCSALVPNGCSVR